MKKKISFVSSLILIVSLMLLLTFTISGCNREMPDDTQANTEETSGTPAEWKDPPTNATPQTVIKKDLPTLTVDMSARGHAILHGSAGFLYGISNEGVPDVNTLTPLKPKVLATKGALGTEHPYGDALDVAEEFFLAGGEQVQMYCSNYYGVFGVTANANEYGNVLRDIIAPAVVEWKEGMRDRFPDIDERIVYIPINEGTPVNGVSGFNAAWKIYYDSIKASDPNAVIAGPNDAVYRGYNEMRSFLSFCRDNGCLPDVITWHELQVSCLDTMDDHIAEYRKICGELGIDEAQVVINEYADFADCGVPGRLVNWIARLEDNQVYGCLPFWHQANNLNDLAANANQGNGAWWVYKWYGDMSGQTLAVSAENTTPDGFYGVAAIDDNKRSSSLICGGVDGDVTIKLDKLDASGVFDGADRVHIIVEASYFTGYHGALYEPDVVLERVFPVKNGTVEIELDDVRFSTAYRITVSETSEEVREPSIGNYRAVYEAEDAVLLGDLLIDIQNSPVEYPAYYCSGGKRVGGIDRKGEGIEYLIYVPVDGLYKLEFIYGNGAGSTRNNASTHQPKNIEQTLIIAGDESVISLPNTLFYSMEGLAERYVSLRAGYHKVSLMYSGDSGAFHDALYVSYAGAYENERAPFNSIYEAEAADFNILGDSKGTTVKAESAVGGFSGSGYVTGLSSSAVENGGGIRFIVAVEKSGLYHLIFRCKTDKTGNIRVYLDNTNLTFDSLISEIPVSVTEGWSEVHATIFLRQGINIVDVDADTDVALDYMRVLWSDIDMSETVEAEGGTGSFDTSSSNGVTYVKEMLANDGYLEFHVNAPADGTYKMQVFQSNNDLCGTHSYNIKIIDRYATFVVNGVNAGRYFFPNTFSDDTFLERTISVELTAGDNTIMVYNDDSWHVLWGGTQSTPGKNELINYTPNFDKFIISPATVDAEIGDMPHNIITKSTGGGYIYCDRSSVSDGSTVTVYVIPDGVIDTVTVNGCDITGQFTTTDGNIYSAEIKVSVDTEVFAVFATAKEGSCDAPDVTVADTVNVGGKSYKVVGENLFSNGDFSDNSGNNMEQWYVGANTAGHPTSGDFMRPAINDDGSLSNLTPLSESGLLIKNAYEPAVSGNAFYFGMDRNQPAGMQNYLVEAIGEPWTSNSWNGADSLLAFIPIKPDTNYYFTFRAYTAGGAASVRFGSINMDNYVQDVYRTTDTLNFSGSGYMACTNGDMQNVGGAWQRFESVINSGDGDYFLFNAYWLQMSEYLCMGDFKLIEVESTPLTKMVGADRQSTVVIKSGDTLDLADTVAAYSEDGVAHEMPVKWLNDSAVDTSAPAVYTVTGYIELPDGYYADGVIYVKQRVIVR